MSRLENDCLAILAYVSRHPGEYQTFRSLSEAMNIPLKTLSRIITWHRKRGESNSALFRIAAKYGYDVRVAPIRTKKFRIFTRINTDGIPRKVIMHQTVNKNGRMSPCTWHVSSKTIRNPGEKNGFIIDAVYVGPQEFRERWGMDFPAIYSREGI